MRDNVDDPESSKLLKDASNIFYFSLFFTAALNFSIFFSVRSSLYIFSYFQDFLYPIFVDNIRRFSDLYKWNRDLLNLYISCALGVLISSILFSVVLLRLFFLRINVVMKLVPEAERNLYAAFAFLLVSFFSLFFTFFNRIGPRGPYLGMEAIYYFPIFPFFSAVSVPFISFGISLLSFFVLITALNFIKNARK